MKRYPKTKTKIKAYRIEFGYIEDEEPDEYAGHPIQGNEFLIIEDKIYIDHYGDLIRCEEMDSFFNL